MNVQQRVPPTGRDFEAYRLVTVGQMSTREVAAELRISQTRICQLVIRVGAFMAEVIPASEEGDKEREIRLAEQIAAERVQFLYGLAVRSFERSAGEQRTTRQATSGIMSSGSVVTTRTSAGDTRYLNCAGRLAILATKLPPPKLAEFIAEEDDEEETAARAVNPQKGDCSVAAREQVSAGAKTPANVAVTASAGGASVSSPATAWKAMQCDVPTVQLPLSPVERKLAAGRPLSPADRKARKRLLEKKLKQSRMAG